MLPSSSALLLYKTGKAGYTKCKPALRCWRLLYLCFGRRGCKGRFSCRGNSEAFDCLRTTESRVQFRMCCLKCSSIKAAACHRPPAGHIRAYLYFFGISHALLYSLCYGPFASLQRCDLAGKLCVFVQILFHCPLRHCPASFLIGLPLFGGACPAAFIGAGCVRQTLGGLRPSGVGGACAYAAIASGTYLQDVIGSLSCPRPCDYSISSLRKYIN